MNKEEWFDHYVSDNSTHAKQVAISMLNQVINDEKFASDGHRNHDAVNFCIGLHVLGFDPEEALDDYEDMWAYDKKMFRDHVERVAAYLDSWGPEGNEGEALKYAI